MLWVDATSSVFLVSTQVHFASVSSDSHLASRSLSSAASCERQTLIANCPESDTDVTGGNDRVAFTQTCLEHRSLHLDLPDLLMLCWIHFAIMVMFDYGSYESICSAQKGTRGHPQGQPSSPVNIHGQIQELGNRQ